MDQINANIKKILKIPFLLEKNKIKIIKLLILYKVLMAKN